MYICGGGGVCYTNQSGIMSGRMLLIDGETAKFRVVKLRTRRDDCAACGKGPSVMTSLLTDYEAFCHMNACDSVSGVQIRSSENRISVSELDLFRQKRQSHLTVLWKRS